MRRTGRRSPSAHPPGLAGRPPNACAQTLRAKLVRGGRCTGGDRSQRRSCSRPRRRRSFPRSGSAPALRQTSAAKLAHSPPATGVQQSAQLNFRKTAAQPWGRCSRSRKVTPTGALLCHVWAAACCGCLTRRPQQAIARVKSGSCPTVRPHVWLCAHLAPVKAQTFSLSKICTSSPCKPTGTPRAFSCKWPPFVAKGWRLEGSVWARSRSQSRRSAARPPSPRFMWETATSLAR